MLKSFLILLILLEGNANQCSLLSPNQPLRLLEGGSPDFIILYAEFSFFGMAGVWTGRNFSFWMLIVFRARTFRGPGWWHRPSWIADVKCAWCSSCLDGEVLVVMSKVQSIIRQRWQCLGGCCHYLYTLSSWYQGFLKSSIIFFH